MTTPSADRPESNNAAASAPHSAAEMARRPRIDWADPKVPAGNAPPLPGWPLYLSAAVFVAWLLFLVAMAIVRVRTVSV